MYRYKIFRLFLLSLLGLFVLHACVDDKISSDPSLRLTFSVDTVTFDTIFTTIGSATQIIKIYNPNNQHINISTLQLGQAEMSPYRINVDGMVSRSNQFSNIEIRAKDSLYVFVEVTIDPQRENSPVFVKDSIELNVNTNKQSIKLIAFGQNMVLLKNKTIYNDTLLTAQKPYVIVGDLKVDTAKTLTLEPGTKLYFNDKASLLVYGNLIAEGTADRPIVMRGDRTDQIFTDIPYNFISNQWGGVFLLNPEGHHRLDFVRMNSGYIGLYFANQNRTHKPTLTILNSKIHNFLKYGLVVQNGDITVANTEISNTGSYAVYLNGGVHRFYHSTIANYFNNTNMAYLQPSQKEGDVSVAIMELNRIVPMRTVFENCIVTGTNRTEMDILTRFDKKYHGEFSTSYIKKENPDTPSIHYQNITWANVNDTVFKNTYFNLQEKKYYNFELDSVSPARDIGNIEIAKKYPKDLNGNDRLRDGKPDAGAYEWQPTPIGPNEENNKK